ncbi:hypothetical protein NDU88_004558 [Pleurodeles waltl]|uniref:Uncharacterized protein n=1 Tax=Pleurodeles waltl TaxID=8319 RepID=A0AAV7TT14_PLEWA|nr:hypothetical protein NDU88_004558 [Pleurodeles waltl]
MLYAGTGTSEVPYARFRWRFGRSKAGSMAILIVVSSPALDCTTTGVRKWSFVYLKAEPDCLSWTAANSPQQASPEVLCRPDTAPSGCKPRDQVRPLQRLEEKGSRRAAATKVPAPLPAETRSPQRECGQRPNDSRCPSASATGTRKVPHLQRRGKNGSRRAVTIKATTPPTCRDTRYPARVQPALHRHALLKRERLSERNSQSQFEERSLAKEHDYDASSSTPKTKAREELDSTSSAHTSDQGDDPPRKKKTHHPKEALNPPKEMMINDPVALWKEISSRIGSGVPALQASSFLLGRAIPLEFFWDCSSVTFKVYGLVLST